MTINNLAVFRISLGLAVVTCCQHVVAASGEMGTGTPNFGSYSAATGTQTIVWSLGNPDVHFPAGCERIVLTPSTMGMDAYKIAVAIMLQAKATNKKVRFYAHAERDGGCGVDYVQLME